MSTPGQFLDRSKARPIHKSFFHDMVGGMEVEGRRHASTRLRLIALVGCPTTVHRLPLLLNSSTTIWLRQYRTTSKSELLPPTARQATRKTRRRQAHPSFAGAVNPFAEGAGLQAMVPGEDVRAAVEETLDALELRRQLESCLAQPVFVSPP